MQDDTGTESYDEFAAQNVFTGEGDSLEQALADGARKALGRHPEGTRFELSRLQVKIRNPRVSDYRIHLSKSDTP